MKAIIIGPPDGGQGGYTLIAEDGEGLAAHYCSNASYAEGDLFRNRPERKEMFDKKGITEFIWLKDSGLTLNELFDRGEKFRANKRAASK